MDRLKKINQSNFSILKFLDWKSHFLYKFKNDFAIIHHLKENYFIIFINKDLSKEIDNNILKILVDEYNTCFELIYLNRNDFFEFKKNIQKKECYSLTTHSFN